MRIHHINWDEPLEVPCQRGALTVGNFDGVHRGHQALLVELRRQAEQAHGPAVVLTFDPHPLQLLRPENCPPILTTIAQRTQLLESYGADFVLILRTTHELLRLTAREFFELVIVQKLQPRVVVPGFNFGFGRNREGTVDKLAGFCREAGIGFVQVAPAELGGATISSSRVRALLEAGDVRQARHLLGRPYLLSGVVGWGQQRGQQIGFPTANLEGIATHLPADGVYAVRVAWEDQTWPGAANIGPNPTFGEHARKIEVHIIGFQGDLYQKTLAVEFIDRLRSTRAFAGVTELVEQLRRDVEEAKKVVADQ